MDGTINIAKDGSVSALYFDGFPFEKLGRTRIKRFTNVEFNNMIRRWEVKRGRSVLFCHRSRQRCLEWEQRTFNGKV